MAVSPAPKLPPPPSDLASRTLPVKRLHAMLFRIHHATKECLHFGKDGGGRFDDPLRKYGVLYAALKPEGAFAEVFLRWLSRMLMLESDLQIRSLSQIVSKPVTCVDLCGPGLRRLSCDNRISTEMPYRCAGLWSRALFEHPQTPDGIMYLSRHNPRFKCVALFDKCRRLLKVKSTEGLMTGGWRAWTINQVSKYNLAIQPLS